MEVKRADTERIEQFLNGELLGDDLKAFEDRLKLDAAFKEEVELHRRTEGFLQQSDVLELTGQLENAHQKTVSKQYDISPIPSTKTRRNWIRAAAAIVLLFLCTYFFYDWRKSSQHLDLFGEYYELYPVYYADRGENISNDDLLKKGFLAYENHDFNTAINELKSASSGELPVAIFYAGLSCLAIDSTDKAIELLSQVIDHQNNFFIQQAEWYRSLAYVKKAETQKAIVELKTMVENSQHAYHENARSLLQVMEN